MYICAVVQCEDRICDVDTWALRVKATQYVTILKVVGGKQFDVMCL